MFSKTWATSPRQYGVIIERDVRIPVRKGVMLDSDVFRPDGAGKFPALLAVHAYPKPVQSMELMPIGFSYARGFMETGDFNFYCRRGYAMVVINVAGTGNSDGIFDNNSKQTTDDIVAAIQWAAKQKWCDGNVGMTGVSHFARVAKRVAAVNPPHLKCIFAPYGWTDSYRDLYYHGGIFNFGFMEHWLTARGQFFKTKHTLPARMGKKAYEQAIAAALADPEISAWPYLVQALQNPEKGANAVACEAILNNLYTDYHKERTVDYAATRIPAYMGGDWGLYGLHFPGDIRAFENWKGPKKLTIGPPVYLDRPLYQYDYESLRWFDHWLKGIDTGMVNEPRVKLFIVGSDEWKTGNEWPLPETRWTPFYLHKNGLLAEHEFFPDDGVSSFEDSPFHHGSVVWKTPPMVENTEICGPIVANVYGSTTDTDILWFASVIHIDKTGAERLLTRGWLRGSQRALDAKKSTPWQPVHLHTRREPLKAGQVYEFSIEIRPYGILLKAGERLALRLKVTDSDESPKDTMEAVGMGHVFRRRAAHVTVHHNAQYPSHLLLPITKGNVVGTFISGGQLPPMARR